MHRRQKLGYRRKAKGYAMLAERTLSDPKQYDDPPDLTSEGSIAGWR